MQIFEEEIEKIHIVQPILHRDYKALAQRLNRSLKVQAPSVRVSRTLRYARSTPQRLSGPENWKNCVNCCMTSPLPYF